MRSLALLATLPLLVLAAACGGGEADDDGGTSQNSTGGSAGSSAGKGGASGSATTGGAAGSTAGKGGASGTGTTGGASGSGTTGGAAGTGTTGGAAGSGTTGGASGSGTTGGAAGTGTTGGAAGTGTTGGAAGSDAGGAAGSGTTGGAAGSDAGGAAGSDAGGAAGSGAAGSDAGGAAGSGTTGGAAGSDAGAAGSSGGSSAGSAGSGGNDSAPMVPGGSFNRANDAALPATVSAFRLDRLQVTVADFRVYHDQLDALTVAALDAALASCQMFEDIPPAWTATAGANEGLPMNCLTRAQADAYCVWSGGKLPTLAQMSFAQVGGDEQRFFPWSSPPSDQTIDMTFAAYEKNFPAVQTVGSFPKGAGRWGHLDLAGNQWNLTIDDDVQPPVPCNDCIGTGNPTRSVRVGGSFSSPKSRLQNNQFDGHPDVNRSDDGFRCARTP